MTSLLSCWASAGASMQGCAALEQQLRTCMDDRVCSLLSLVGWVMWVVEVLNWWWIGVGWGADTFGLAETGRRGEEQHQFPSCAAVSEDPGAEEEGGGWEEVLVLGFRFSKGVCSVYTKMDGERWRKMYRIA